MARRYAPTLLVQPRLRRGIRIACPARKNPCSRRHRSSMNPMRADPE